jgi:hypothetical protein
MGLKQSLYDWLYRRWRSPLPGLVDGYTLLLTVPPDLPVFLRLAVDICGRQDLSHLVETIVVPDHQHPLFPEIVQDLAGKWPAGRIRLVEIPKFDRTLRGLVRANALIHWFQLMAGVEATRTRHALLHDADLFLFNPRFLREHYEECARRELYVVGLERPWNKSEWWGQKSFDHLVALWEIEFDVAWMRSMPPAAVRPQPGRFPHGQWWFETSLLAQARTDPARIARRSVENEYIHFQFIISAFRRYQRAVRDGDVFSDRRFGLLLIRLLIDSLDSTGFPYEAPTMSELHAALREPTPRITYAFPEVEVHYASFRSKLERLLTSGLFEGRVVESMRAGVRPFDDRLAADSRKFASLPDPKL